MPSINRFVKVDKVMGVGVINSDDIFRAIKITDDNHHTVQLFAGQAVAFSPRVKKNKSRTTEYEVIQAQTERGTRRICMNGDYIYRRKDGRFFTMHKGEFEAKYKKTHLRIKDS